jgi:hypothetical protein
VATSKFTLGMTLVSTRAEMRDMSPAWMPLSALAASMTSMEIWRTSVVGGGLCPDRSGQHDGGHSRSQGQGGQQLVEHGSPFK